MIAGIISEPRGRGISSLVANELLLLLFLPFLIVNRLKDSGDCMGKGTDGYEGEVEN